VQADLALLGPIAPANLIDTLGVLGVLLILFAETGLLVGFFLPGDSLLFVAGYATVAGNSLHLHLPLGWLLVAAAVGAIAGAETGYFLGLRAGPALFRKPEAKFFRQDYVERTDRAFLRFGPARAVVIARFVPVIRTFMNPMAGVVRMPVREFTIWNVTGGLMWTVGLVLLGHWVGHVSVVRKHIELLVLLVVVLSVLPLLTHIVRETRRARSARGAS
jgi:membrane-associated protein